jgi:hypothetical protein
VLTVVVLAACGLIYWQWLTGHAYYFLEVVYSIMTGRRFKKKKTPPLIKTMFRDKNVVVPTVATRIPT